MSSFASALESFMLNFQNGVRRSVLIFAGIIIFLLIPVYFVAQGISAFWSVSEFNPNTIVYENIVNPKTTTIYNYRVDRSQNVPLINGETVLYTTINNNINQNVGYFPYHYRIQVLDSERSIVFENNYKSYILPGKVKYLIINPANDKGLTLNIIEEPKTQVVLFNKLANDFDEISESIEVRNPQLKESSENKNQLEISGIIKNKSLVEIKEVDVLYIIRGTRDKVVGIGEQKISNLKPGEERLFFSFYPKPKYRRATKLDLRATVNYLDSSNFRIQ